MARNELLRRLEADMARSTERWRIQREAREAAENEAISGQRIVAIERDSMGQIDRIRLENGLMLCPRSNDSGESWIEAEET